MQTIIISGNLGKDAELRQTQGGDNICSFSLGVKQGWGDKASTNWYRCNVWGKRGTTVSEYLRKGVKVFVTGELTIGEYNGKPQFDVRVNEVEWERAQRQESGNGGGYGRQGRAQQNSALDDDFGDGVPFVSDGRYAS